MDGEPSAFHGVRTRVRSLQGFRLTESTYEAGHRLPLHAHPHPFFALLLSGSYTERLESGERRCAPSSLAYYPAGVPHADRFHGRGGRAFLVEVCTSDLDPFDEMRAGDTRHLGEMDNGRLKVLALRLYAESLSSWGPDELGAEELGLEMVAELQSASFSQERSPPPWLERVRERLHAEFRGRIRIAALAADASVHPVYLTRVFRRHHGCTIGAYVERLRVQQAYAAIVGSDESLSRLAADLGYADQAHFTRRFKASVGTTPGRLRRLATR